jgi:hypothetical protein
MDSLESELVGFSAELVNLRSKFAAAGPAGQPASAANQKLQTSITLCLGAHCNSQGPGSGEANGGGKRRRLQSFACASASVLKARSRDVNSECCPEGNCSEDMPTDCSLACATVRPPVQPVRQSSQRHILVLSDKRQT